MLEKRSVCADALARAGGLDRNEGELDSMWVDDLRLAPRREFSVDQDISMSAEAVSRSGGRLDGVSGDADRLCAHAAPRRRNPR